MPKGIPGKPIITCAACGEEKEHCAKGLCRGCYSHRHHRRYYEEHQEELVERARGYRRANPEKVKAANRRCYAKHRAERRAHARHWRKENPAEARARSRRNHKKHIEKEREYWRRYSKIHREEKLAYNRQWRRLNPDKAAAQDARKRARKQSVPRTLTAEQGEELLAIGRATYPGEKLHLDHIVPLSKGGGTTRANIHAIPAWMNHMKYDKLPEEIYQQMELA